MVLNESVLSNYNNYNSSPNEERSNNDSRASNRKFDVIRFVSYEFNLENCHNLVKSTNHLLSVSYNNRQKMFILLDPCGLVTWEWKNPSNKTTRVLAYPDFEYKHIVDIIYCKLHNCYFGLKGDYTLTVLNREFEEIYSVGDSMRSILCMKYNPVNDELITCGLEGVKVWCLKQSTTDNPMAALKQMSNYKLVIKKELDWIKDWIRKIDVDTLNCHLYCCTTVDLFIYDFNGNLIRAYKECHRTPISSCVYSPTAKVVLTGSQDGDIKVWSLGGGHIDTFRAHNKTVTNLILNPFNSNLVISSSKDGSVKMWSLDIMESIYELNYFEEEVLWMGVTEDKYLYIASTLKITIWSINNFIDYWASTRDKVTKVDISKHEMKSTRVISSTQDGTIRIFNRDTANHVTTILPIPDITANQLTRQVSYCRTYNVFFILLDTGEIWSYYAKSSPATHVGIWKAIDLQKEYIDSQEETNTQKIKPAFRFLSPNAQMLTTTYRSLQYGIIPHQKPEECRCMCILESPVVFYNENGEFCPPVTSFLLLGLQNGNIIFCDPIIEGKKYISFNCHKDPIIEISHDRVHHCLVTKTEFKQFFRIQYWSLPYLELSTEFYCLNTVSSYARIGYNVFIGFNDGAVDFLTLKIMNETSLRIQFLSETEIEELTRKELKYEHKEKIEIVDACHTLKLFLTCSTDGCIKVWTQHKQLLAEITLKELSYAMFLNNLGDILIGWHKSLFYIHLHKVIPNLFSADTPDTENESEEVFSDESSIIEDPTLKITSAVPDQTDITLETYLRPFSIDFETKKWENPLRKSEMENEKKRGTARDDDETSSRSSISTLPRSFYSTPTDSATFDFLPNVDLTLNANVRQVDVKAYLIELFRKSLAKGKKKGWKFPKFGTSPGSTPTITPSTMSPTSEIEITEVKSEEEVEAPRVPLRVVQPEVKLVARKKPDQSDMERKLRERMPTQYQPSNYKNARIDSKNLIGQAKGPSKMSSSRETKPQVAEKTEIKVLPRRVVKKPAQKVKQFLPVKEMRLSEGDASKPQKLPSLVTELSDTNRKKTREKTDSSSGNASRKTSANLVKSYRMPSFDSKSLNKLTDIDDEGDGDDEENDPKQFRAMDSEDKDQKQGGKAKPRNKRMIRLFNYKKPTNNNEMNSKHSRIVESIEPPDEVESSMRMIKPSAMDLNNNSRAATSTQFSTSIVLSRQDNKYTGLWDPVLDTNPFKKRERKINRIIYDEEDLKKIDSLFKYYYGISEPPSRVKTAKYSLSDTSRNKSFENSATNSKSSFSLEDSIRKSEESTKKVFKNYDNWLDKFEKKREKHFERTKSAKQRQQELMDESLRKWSDSIEKKNHTKIIKYNQRPFTGDPRTSQTNNDKVKISKREIQSAYVVGTSKSDKKRPKSVTFVEDNDRKPGENVNVEAPYLVSAIEMEEILQEAASRNSIMKSRSSVTMIPDIYYTKYGFPKPKSNQFYDSSERLYVEDSESDSDLSNDYFDDSHSYSQKTYAESMNLSMNSTLIRKQSPCSDNLFEKRSEKPSIRINSCIIDYRTSAANQSVPKFDSSSSYRISLKSQEEDRSRNTRNRRYYSKERRNHISEEDETDLENINFVASSSNFGDLSESAKEIKRGKSPSSIPSKCRRYKVIDYPEVKLEYKIPGFPERYLLPIRFPKLHRRIVLSLLKFKSSKIKLPNQQRVFKSQKAF